MQLHQHFSDSEFEQLFETCQMDPTAFSHEAHLRLAWIHVKKYGQSLAIKNICDQLLQYVEYLGAKDKFNITLTIAAIKAVNHFIQKSASDNFQDFINEFPRLKFNFKELMQCHYQIDIYNLQSAKQQFLEPDLLPF